MLAKKPRNREKGMFNRAENKEENVDVIKTKEEAKLLTSHFHQFRELQSNLEETNPTKALPWLSKF